MLHQPHSASVTVNRSSAATARRAPCRVEGLEGRTLLSVAAGGGDPDDEISEATTVAIGATVEDEIDNPDDVDMYRFTASAGQTLTFDIDVNVDVGNLDSYIRLFDSTGVDFNFNDDAPGPGDEFSSRESFLSHTFDTAGTYYLGVSEVSNQSYNPTTGNFDDGTGFTGGYFLTIDVGDVDAPPTVTAVYVDSSGWNPAFRQYLQDTGQGSAALGYLVPGGVAQVDEMPWTNLNRVHVQFSEDVSVQQADLAIRGVTVANYNLGPAANFTYNAATRTASWTLAANVFFVNDKIRLDLDADAATGGVTDLAGNALDGEWSNPTEATPPAGGDAYPSGNGTAGGDFRFRMNVLPGDVNRSGQSVNSQDLQLVRNRQFTSTTNPGNPPNLYTAFHDVNGNGGVNSIDLQLVRNNQFKMLPAGNPSLVAPTTDDDDDEWDTLLR